MTMAAWTPQSIPLAAPAATASGLSPRAASADRTPQRLSNPACVVLPRRAAGRQPIRVRDELRVGAEPLAALTQMRELRMPRALDDAVARLEREELLMPDRSDAPPGL